MDPRQSDSVTLLEQYKELYKGFILIGEEDEAHEDFFDEQLELLSEKLKALGKQLPHYLALEKGLKGKALKQPDLDETFEVTKFGGTLQQSAEQMIETLRSAIEIHNRLDQRKLKIKNFVNREAIQTILETERELLNLFSYHLPIPDGFIEPQNQSTERSNVTPLEFYREEISPPSYPAHSNLHIQLSKAKPISENKKTINAIVEAVKTQEKNEQVLAHYNILYALLKNLNKELAQTNDLTRIEELSTRSQSIILEFTQLVLYRYICKKENAILEMENARMNPAIQEMAKTLDDSLKTVLDHLSNKTLSSILLQEHTKKLYNSVEIASSNFSPKQGLRLFLPAAMPALQAKLSELVQDKQIQAAIKKTQILPQRR